MLDEAARAWSPAAFAACEADPAWAPRLFEGSAPVGRMRPEVADELGLPRGVLMAAGGGDAAVGAVGLGAIGPGEAFISLGTATQLIVATDRYISAPERLVHSFAHALPDRWYAMAAMLNGAGALAFAGRLLGASPDALEREAADGLSRARRASLPALSLRRAHAARRSLCARRAVRHERDDDARRCRARGDGGRRADACRGARLPRRRGRDDRARRPHRRRREERLVDPHDRRRDRLYRRAHARRRNRPALTAPRALRGWRRPENRPRPCASRRRSPTSPSPTRGSRRCSRNSVRGSRRFIRGEGGVPAGGALQTEVCFVSTRRLP